MNERYLKYESKINTRYLKDTILNASYMCDRKNSAYKPVLSNDELAKIEAEVLLFKESICEVNFYSIHYHNIYLDKYIVFL